MILVDQERWIQKTLARKNRALEAQPAKRELIENDIAALTAVLRTVQQHRRFQEAIDTVKRLPAAANFLQ
jgi:hypothetical protein